MSLAPPPPRNNPPASFQPGLAEWFSIDPRDEKEIAYYPQISDKIEAAFQSGDDSITLTFDQRPYKIVFEEMQQFNNQGGSRKVLRKTRSTPSSNDWKLTCSNFLSKAGCTWGAKCRYVHANPQAQQQQQPLANNNNNGGSTPSTPAATICRYFAKGVPCPNGSQCRYRHESPSASSSSTNIIKTASGAVAGASGNNNNNTSSSSSSFPSAGALIGAMILASILADAEDDEGDKQKPDNICRNFNTPAGCPRGSSCRFSHVSTTIKKSAPSQPQQQTQQPQRPQAPTHLALLFDTCALHDLTNNTQYLDFLLRNDNVVIFPYAVVDELDNQNHVKGQGNDKQQNLKATALMYRDWVLHQKTTNRNPNLILQSRSHRSQDISVHESINDNNIIGAAMFYGKSQEGKTIIKTEFAKTPGHNPNKLRFVIVTNDKFMHVKAIAENLQLVSTQQLQQGNVMELVKNDPFL